MMEDNMEDKVVGNHRSEKDVESVISTPEILKHKYRYVRLIGEGSNGKTYLAVERLSGMKVAIKQLKTVNDFKSFDLFKREVATMQSVNIEGVPKYIDYVESRQSIDDYYLIQEYIEGRTLLDCIDEMNENATTFSESKVWEFARCMVSILQALETEYQPPIIHRDIKPSNVLVTPDGNYYLIDFGAVANPERKSLNSTIAGTQGYMAPEQLMGDCTIQSDYYGLGATMLHMLTGVAPFKIDNVGLELQFKQVIDETAPTTSARMRSVLSVLLAVKPEERPRDSRELYDIIVECSMSKSNRQCLIQANKAYIEAHPKLCRIGASLEKHRTKRAFLAFVFLLPLGYLWIACRRSLQQSIWQASIFVVATVGLLAFAIQMGSLGWNIFVLITFIVMLILVSAMHWTHLNRDEKEYGFDQPNPYVALMQYEKMSSNYSIHSEEGTQEWRGSGVGIIERVWGGAMKKAIYTVEIHDDVYVGAMCYGVDDYNEDLYNKIHEQKPDEIEAFRENLNDDDYLVGAKVQVAYEFYNKEVTFRINDEQDDMRMQLFKPWMK